MQLRARTASLLEEPSSVWRHNIHQCERRNASVMETIYFSFVSSEVKGRDSLSRGGGVFVLLFI
jgi:hypothetical protein